MTDLRPALDEGKVALVRAFLQRSFPDSQIIDTFDFERTAQRFVVNPGGPNRQTLILTRDATEHPTLEDLLNQTLLDTMSLRAPSPVRLTSEGPKL